MNGKQPCLRTAPFFFRPQLSHGQCGFEGHGDGFRHLLGICKGLKYGELDSGLGILQQQFRIVLCRASTQCLHCSAGDCPISVDFKAIQQAFHCRIVRSLLNRLHSDKSQVGIRLGIVKLSKEFGKWEAEAAQGRGEYCTAAAYLV